MALAKASSSLYCSVFTCGCGGGGELVAEEGCFKEAAIAAANA